MRLNKETVYQDHTDDWCESWDQNVGILSTFLFFVLSAYEQTGEMNQ